MNESGSCETLAEASLVRIIHSFGQKGRRIRFKKIVGYFTSRVRVHRRRLIYRIGGGESKNYAALGPST